MNNRVYIDVEIEGLEELEELVEEMKEHEKETTVFECELGQGLKFKGTKSDFETYVNGLIRMMKLGQLFN